MEKKENLNEKERRFDVELSTYNPIYRTFGKRRKVFSKLLTNVSSGEILEQIKVSFDNGYVKTGGKLEIVNRGVRYPGIPGRLGIEYSEEMLEKIGRAIEAIDNKKEELEEKKEELLELNSPYCKESALDLNKICLSDKKEIESLENTIEEKEEELLELNSPYKKEGEDADKINEKVKILEDEILNKKEELFELKAAIKGEDVFGPGPDNELVGGITGLDTSLYREQLVKVIAENVDVSTLDLITGDLSPKEDRISIDASDINYINKVFKSYAYFCDRVREERLFYDKPKEYNLALRILDKFCLKSGKPLTIKIGNRHEGTPTQVLYHLASELLNSSKTNNLVQSVICDEEGEIRKEFRGAFKKNYAGIVRPVYSDCLVSDFTRSRFRELGLDSLFTFKSGHTKLKTVKKTGTLNSNNLDSFDKKFNSF